MKCTNRLETLALLGTLLVGSVGIRADGTLPIPVSTDELPVTLNGSASNGTTPRMLEMELDASSGNSDSQYKSRCRSNESFYPASGQIRYKDVPYAIQGICSPGGAPASRKQIIATNYSELLLLDGMLTGSSNMTFSGQMKLESSDSPSPESGGGSTSYNFSLERTN